MVAGALRLLASPAAFICGVDKEVQLMAWRWGVHDDWEPELQARYEMYGERFKEEVEKWLELLAKAGARNQELDGFSRRLDADLDDIHAGKLSGWRHTWRQWSQEPWLSRIRAILHVLTRTKPPWELWEGERPFSSVASSFSCRIGTTFKVDRLNSTVNFIWFTGLPGPGVKD